VRWGEGVGIAVVVMGGEEEIGGGVLGEGAPF